MFGHKIIFQSHFISFITKLHFWDTVFKGEYTVQICPHTDNKDEWSDFVHCKFTEIEKEYVKFIFGMMAMFGQGDIHFPQWVMPKRCFMIKLSRKKGYDDPYVRTEKNTTGTIDDCKDNIYLFLSPHEKNKNI